MSLSAITALLRVIGSTEYSKTVINSSRLDSQYSARKYIISKRRTQTYDETNHIHDTLINFAIQRAL